MINTDCAVGEILDMVHRLLALGFKNEFHEILYRVIHTGNPDNMLTVLRDMHSRVRYTVVLFTTSKVADVLGSIGGREPAWSL